MQVLQVTYQINILLVKKNYYITHSFMHSIELMAFNNTEIEQTITLLSDRIENTRKILININASERRL